MKRLIVPIFILIIVMGCKEVFVAPPQALLLATFYRSSTNLAVSPELTAKGFGRDSFLVYRQTGSSLLFPLTFKDTTQYVLSMDTISKPDSITFIHQSTKKYASVETGFYYEYKLLSVKFTHNRIDSLKIIDSLVTTKWHENIKLYLHSLPVVGK